MIEGGNYAISVVLLNNLSDKKNICHRSELGGMAVSLAIHGVPWFAT
jgi:hypothetical protein